MAWVEMEYLNIRNGRIQGHTIFISSDAAFIEFLQRVDTNAENVRSLQIDGKGMEPLPFIKQFLERV